MEYELLKNVQKRQCRDDVMDVVENQGRTTLQERWFNSARSGISMVSGKTRRENVSSKVVDYVANFL